MYSDLFIILQQGLGTPQLALVFVAAGLLGSIPFGLLLTRLAGLGDVRRIGSGNIGATNVLRTGRRDIALATLLLDIGKGAVAVLAARALYGVSAEILAALAVVLGHMFPIWLGFRGGKGVASFLGVALALDPVTGLAACGVWLLTAALFRYSSLASLAAAAVLPPCAWYLVDHLHMELALVLAALIWLKHRGNIRRLVLGEEPKIGWGGGGDSKGAGKGGDN